MNVFDTRRKKNQTMYTFFFLQKIGSPDRVPSDCRLNEDRSSL